MKAPGGRRVSPEFSVVVPVSTKDLDMIPKTLPAYLKLQAGEIILCVDSPVDPALRQAIVSVGRGDPRLRIVEVPADPSWKFHQALARRTGFRAASSDVILTGDIDVVVNSNVLRGVERVGRDNVGVANLQKEMRSGPGDILRNMSRRVVRSIKREAFWSGLYALYRPYWLDTEDEEFAKKVPHPAEYGVVLDQDKFFSSLIGLGNLTTPPYFGDETILKWAMFRKHKVVSLPFVGGVEIRKETARRREYQARQAVRIYLDGRSLAYVLLRAILSARGVELGTYMFLVRRESGTPQLLIAISTIPLKFTTYVERVALRGLGVRSEKPTL